LKTSEDDCREAKHAHYMPQSSKVLFKAEAYQVGGWCDDANTLPIRFWLVNWLPSFAVHSAYINRVFPIWGIFGILVAQYGWSNVSLMVHIVVMSEEDVTIERRFLQSEVENDEGPG
jgi:hypothetical protein